MSKKVELDKIFIRAKVLGEWGSYSLEELFKGDHIPEIMGWIVSKLLEKCEVKTGEKVTRGNIIKLIKLLEKNGVTILRLR